MTHTIASESLTGHVAGAARLRRTKIAFGAALPQNTPIDRTVKTTNHAVIFAAETDCSGSSSYRRGLNLAPSCPRATPPLSQNVAGYSWQKYECDMRDRRAPPLCFPMQAISFASKTNDSVARHTMKQGVSAIWRKSICYDGLTHSGSAGCLKMWR